MLTADRDSRRRGEEGTGEVESLHGRMKGQKMGDRLDKGSKPEVGVCCSSSSSRAEVAEAVVFLPEPKHRVDEMTKLRLLLSALECDFYTGVW